MKSAMKRALRDNPGRWSKPAIAAVRVERRRLPASEYVRRLDVWETVVRAVMDKHEVTP